MENTFGVQRTGDGIKIRSGLARLESYVHRGEVLPLVAHLAVEGGFTIEEVIEAIEEVLAQK